jgi:hypothetical protein
VTYLAVLPPVLADRKCSILDCNSSSRPLRNCNSSTTFTVKIWQQNNWTVYSNPEALWFLHSL